MKINLSEIKKTGANYITLNHFSEYENDIINYDYLKPIKSKIGYFLLYDIKNKKWRQGLKFFRNDGYIENVKDGYLVGKKAKVFFFKNEKNLDKLIENYQNIQFK